MKAYRLIKFCVCASIVALSLSACMQQSSPKTLAGTAVSNRAIVTASDYLRQAKNAPREEALALQCQAAQSLVESNRYSDAQALITRLISSGLSTVELDCFQLVQANLYLRTNRAQSAKSLLVTMRFQAMMLDGYNKRRHLVLLGQAYAELGQQLMFIKTQARLIRLESGMPSQRIHAVKLWDALIRYPQSQLNFWLKQVSSGSETAGWLKLAKIMGQPTVGSTQWYRSLSLWKETYGSHSAAQFLQDVPDMADQVLSTSPQSIALLLPLTGPHAKQGLSVRRGFYAAYYANEKQQAMTIRVLDTHSASMADLLQQLQDQGITRVVGPLLKDKVQEFASLKPSSLQVLALNTIPDTVSGMVQYSLSPESNIDQMVAKMATEKKWRVAIIMPDTAYAARLYAHFKRLWAGYGGDVVGVLSYRKTSNQAAELRNLLGVDQGRARHRLLERATGLKSRFLERPRQDIDAFLFLGDWKSAESFKPLLRFYFLGKRSFFAMPSVARAVMHQRKPDLNGIDCLVTPWELLAANRMPESLATTRAQLKKLWPTATRRYGVFYAMGADAYALTTRLSAAHPIPGFSYFGQTGLLTIDASNRVFPRLLWATFKSGKPVLMNQSYG